MLNLPINGRASKNQIRFRFSIVKKQQKMSQMPNFLKPSAPYFIYKEGVPKTGNTTLHNYKVTELLKDVLLTNSIQVQVMVDIKLYLMEYRGQKVEGVFLEMNTKLRDNCKNVPSFSFYGYMPPRKKATEPEWCYRTFRARLFDKPIEGEHMFLLVKVGNQHFLVEYIKGATEIEDGKYKELIVKDDDAYDPPAEPSPPCPSNKGKVVEEQPREEKNDPPIVPFFESVEEEENFRAWAREGITNGYFELYERIEEYGARQGRCWLAQYLFGNLRRNSTEKDDLEERKKNLKK